MAMRSSNMRPLFEEEEEEDSAMDSEDGLDCEGVEEDEDSDHPYLEYRKNSNENRLNRELLETAMKTVSDCLEKLNETADEMDIFVEQMQEEEEEEMKEKAKEEEEEEEEESEESDEDDEEEDEDDEESLAET